MGPDTPLVSHPTRVRGLKHKKEPRQQRRNHVAPHAGAWIETGLGLGAGTRIVVAPHAGAWIETRYRRKNSKLEQVAPHAGAWIETVWPWPPSPAAASHPTRVRGLKPARHAGSVGRRGSHPTRVRGLKQRPRPSRHRAARSHPTRVRGLKLFSGHGHTGLLSSHPTRVRGLKPACGPCCCAPRRRTPRGCVD